MENFELTEKERISYILQLKILSKLYPEDPTYKELSIALESGYTYHYSDLASYFLEDELPVEDCKLVLDILDMYRGIIFSAKHFKWSDMNRVRFPGFDYNDSLELKMGLYAQYFMEVLKRYDEIRELSKGDYNSHMKMLPKYTKMLTYFRGIKKIDNYRMSEDDLNYILNIV